MNCRIGKNFKNFLQNFLIIYIIFSNFQNLMAIIPSTLSELQINQNDIHNINNNNNSKQKLYNQEGYWFNKGHQFNKCLTNYHDINECEKYSINQLMNEKFNLYKPNYGILFKKIRCILQKINCPSNDRSFQIHDIPCQSACLSLISICEQLRASSSYLPSVGCPAVINRQVPRTRKRWLWNTANSNNSPIPYEPININELLVENPNTYSHRQTRHPNTGLYLPFKEKTTTNYGLSRSSLTLRRPKRSDRQVILDPKYSEKVQHFRSNINQPYFYEQNTQLYFSPRYKQTFQQRTDLEINIKEEDCLFLPPGGCDKWSDYLTNIQRLEHPTFQEKLKLNFGCPKFTEQLCNSMFPTLYTRNQWIKANFTVAAIIRISGTLWWFGKNDRFQPLFRFHVLKTFDSDIHPYDEKMILTYSWPTQCICPNEIVVGKKYLLLTHSFKTRQTLHITKNTVFLSRVKRYTRKLACWKGACIHKSGRNRHRRYHYGRSSRMQLAM